MLFSSSGKGLSALPTCGNAPEAARVRPPADSDDSPARSNERPAEPNTGGELAALNGGEAGEGMLMLIGETVTLARRVGTVTASVRRSGGSAFGPARRRSLVARFNLPPSAPNESWSSVVQRRC